MSALLLIAAIGSQLTKDMKMVDIHERVEKQVRHKVFLADMDIVAQQTLEKFPNKTALKPAFDTLFENLKEKTNGNRDSIHMDSYILSQGIEQLDFMISNEDYLNLSPEELVDKYKVEGKVNRFIFKQKIKLFKDKGNFGPFVLGNSLWIILLMMPFLALILKILYARHDFYYVEHLVFSFHTHSFAFLLFAIIGFFVLLGGPIWLIAIGIFILFFYLFKALQKVYGQGRFKTFVKVVIANSVYFFLFLFFFVFGVLASMAIF